jgi:predicted LPLAT superfamily acyltransferase
VVLDTEVGRVRNLFEHALKGRQFRLLTTDGHPLRSVPILAALKRGEIVALHGDRSLGGGGDLAVPFLGGTAHFPLGAYRLAAFSGAPIFPGFTVRERMGAYWFFVLPPMCIHRELRRAAPESLRAHVTEYAAGLESVVRRYPFQWYNFYPFWDPPSETPAGAARQGTMDSTLST